MTTKCIRCDSEEGMYDDYRICEECWRSKVAYSIRMNYPLLLRAKAFAKKNYRPISSIVHEAIRDYLDRKEREEK